MTLLDTLQIDLPIIQAPMASVSSPAMAAAVANAGALGSIGVGATDAEGTRRMIEAVRQHSRRSLNVNVFCHEPARADRAIETAWIERLRPRFEAFGVAPPRELREMYRSFRANEALLAVLLASRPRVVSFHFGLPEAQAIGALRNAGIVLLACATNIDDALAAQAAGVQAVIAQGYEAGGHRGVFDLQAPDACLSTSVLTQLLVRKLKIPVIAAGGIMDGKGIAAALTLGASAAQLGTAFIGCRESEADSAFRETLASPAAQCTVMTRAISGRPARCLANAFTRLGADIDSREIPSYPIAYDAGKALNQAAKAAHESGYGAQWAGQGAPLARLGLPAAEMVAILAAELHQSRAPR